MASLVLSGDTSGSITVAAPAVSGSNTQTLVATTGTLAPVVSGTSQTAPFTDNTRAEFTGIPSWVKRITVMFSNVGTNGTSNPQVQIGSGSFTITGYSSVCSGYQNTASGATATFTSGFGINSASAAATLFGSVRIENISGNTWAATVVVGSVGSGVSFFGGGSLSLGGVLDRVRVTTVNGTDTFDTGSVINILYE